MAGENLSATSKKPKKIPAICKACLRCRAKKAKCDGLRPACGSCTKSRHECRYLSDARLSKRPSRHNSTAQHDEIAWLRSRLQDLEASRTGEANNQAERHVDRTTSHNDAVDLELIPATNAGATDQWRSAPAIHAAQQQSNSGPGIASTHHNVNGAAVAQDTEDNSIQVHGLPSYLNNPTKWLNCRRGPDRQSISIYANDQSIRDRLFANAAYQRQRESSILTSTAYSIGGTIDLDGLSSELAVHLLDLYWNRKHYAYLMTYRPAFFDSLATNGPYANKLLLNAIYFSSSCLDSDRPVFQNVKEPHRRGDRFYKRFKSLLVEEIDKPSLPTIVALVVAGATLVSTGQQNAGWVICGIAYRMILDMGLHLIPTPSQDQSQSQTHTAALEHEMRTRIYWAAFMIDNYQALYLGRRPTLRSLDTHALQDLNDYYEELETWQPYIDPETPPSPLKTLLAAYTPRPAYAVSTFGIFVSLGQIAESVAAFYAADCLNTDVSVQLVRREELRQSLCSWLDQIPIHLRFNPDTDPTPPPNQLVPHALYHTLVILLERPFLRNGHLAGANDAVANAAAQKLCRSAAFNIWRILESYERAFTFRRTPHLMSYAAYCATVALLHPDQVRDKQYKECIKFFWHALRRIQQGTHFGLSKPLKILQNLLRCLGQGLPEDPSASAEDVHQYFAGAEQPGRGYADALGNPTPEDGNFAYRYTPNAELDTFLQQGYMTECMQQDSWMMPAVNDFGQVTDSLIGLLDPCQPLMEGFNSW